MTRSPAALTGLGKHSCWGSVVLQEQPGYKGPGCLWRPADWPSSATLGVAPPTHTEPSLQAPDSDTPTGTPSILLPHQGSINTPHTHTLGALCLHPLSPCPSHPATWLIQCLRKHGSYGAASIRSFTRNYLLTSLMLHVEHNSKTDPLSL